MRKTHVAVCVLVGLLLGSAGAYASDLHKQLTDLTVTVWAINQRADARRVEKFLTFEDSVDPVRLEVLADRLAKEGLHIDALIHLSGKSSKALREYLKSPQAIGVAPRLSQEIDKLESNP